MNGAYASFFPLRLTPGADGIFLRNLCGADELAVEDTGTRSLVAFLELLMQDDPPVNKVRAAEIVTSDRDRLLARLYMSLYGPKVESTIHCQNCNEKFDLDFSLEDLLKHYQIQPVEVSSRGNYELEPGIIFRLPTGEDEMHITAATKDDREKLLLERCLVEGNPDLNSEKVQLKMAELAPVLSMEMEAVCPECKHSQTVHFDIQSFLLTKIKQERPLLLREVHLIASYYHWSHREILELPRNLRKHYAALIQSGN